MILEEIGKLDVIAKDGYVHIKSFLTEEEVEGFKSDFESKNFPDSSENKNYHIPYISEEVTNKIKSKLFKVSEETSKYGVKADIVEGVELIFAREVGRHSHSIKIMKVIILGKTTQTI
jgi:hypothetical protein